MTVKEIEQLLEESLKSLPDCRVRDAMHYSLLGGGKRIRPLLLFYALNGYGVDEKAGIPFATGLEMIQTYSLIHDDLPAMDNDDLRRGQPTCHKKFDEATAILAGDGLLTEAFHQCARSDQPAERVVKCISILSEMAGPAGVVYGQCLDTLENPQYDWDMLKKVHRYKTGCLLASPLMMAAVLAGKDDAVVSKWQKIGFELGLAFQIQDDILDETKSAAELGKSNSDERNHKVTSVSLLGMERAKQVMAQLYEGCCTEMEQMGDFDATEICGFVRRIAARQM